MQAQSATACASLKNRIKSVILLIAFSCCVSRLGAAVPFYVTSRVDTQRTGSEGAFYQRAHYVDTMTLEIGVPASVQIAELIIHFVVQDKLTKRYQFCGKRTRSDAPPITQRLIIKSDPLPYSREKSQDRTASPKTLGFVGWVLEVRTKSGEEYSQGSSDAVLDWFFDTRPRKRS